MSTIDQKLPVATIVFLVSIVLTCIAYANGEIDYLQAAGAVGALGLGSGAVGISRSMAGKGK